MSSYDEIRCEMTLPASDLGPETVFQIRAFVGVFMDGYPSAQVPRRPPRACEPPSRSRSLDFGSSPSGNPLTGSPPGYLDLADARRCWRRPRWFCGRPDGIRDWRPIARRAADRFLGHFDGDAQERAGPRIMAKDFVTLCFKLGSVDLDQLHIVRTAGASEFLQLLHGERPAFAGRTGPFQSAQMPYGGMVFKFHSEMNLYSEKTSPAVMPPGRG